MNREKIESLPRRVLVLGAAAAAVRGLLYLLAVDNKGLLVRGHGLQWLLWALCAAAVAAVLPVCKLKGSNRCEDNFDPGVYAACGSFAMAVGVVLTLLMGNSISRGTLSGLWLLSGILAAAGQVWAGLDQRRGRHPMLLTQAVLCLFVAVHAVTRYQAWSGNPQVQDWVFSLLATVGLTLCAYHRTAFGAGVGHRRVFLVTALLTVFSCCAAAPHTEYLWLYLGGGLWAYTGLCRVTPVAAPEQPAETE